MSASCQKQTNTCTRTYTTHGKVSCVSTERKKKDQQNVKEKQREREREREREKAKEQRERAQKKTRDDVLVVFGDLRYIKFSNPWVHVSILVCWTCCIADIVCRDRIQSDESSICM
jgi:uncharacterized membrane protein